MTEIYQQKGEPFSTAADLDLSRTLALILDEVQIRNTQLRLDIPQKEAELLSRLQNNQENQDKILRVIADCLAKSQDSVKQRLLRLVPDRVLQQILTGYIFRSNDLKSVIALIGVVLQATDDFNLLTLAYLTQEEIRSQVPKMLTQATFDLLKALVRCIVAQPVLCDVWDLSTLVPIDSSLLEGEIGLLVGHIKIILGHPNSVDDKAQARVQLVDSLLLNKSEETRCKALVGHPEEVEVKADLKSNELVCTDYLFAKASLMLKQMERKPFGHFSISGPSGSGKMSLIQIVNQLYFQRHGTINDSIVVTLESSFDSKNLVGTYVCNETGEFQFKKGPLTVAAEKGMWLILRNIEDTPSDLLSFLLPIIQENVLLVTSTMTIKPKLGFRIFVLSKNSQIDDRVHYSHEDIQPLLSLMHKHNVDSLVCDNILRPDFEQILMRRFPCLFLELQPGFNLHNLLWRSIQYLTHNMSLMRPHLLDYRPYTVHQLLQVYRRVDAHFQYISNSDTKQISQAQRQLIVEEIADVYLGYLYDLPSRQKLLQSLIQTQFNLYFDGSIDGESVSEYCVKLGREYGISTQSCFFGRITMDRVSQETVQTNFVYTGATVRLLEQISASIKMKEPILLVGETGTGKTTAVQEVAKVLGKQLHVFNMNQNTDSADLMGGFKPVDLKYLLKPIYELFLSVFTTMFQKTPNNTKYLDLTQKCYQANKVKEFLQCIQHGLASIKSKKDDNFANQLSKLEQQHKELQKRTKKLESSGGFVFQFVEGTLIKSMQNGDWVLLDEINLASESVLNRLATVIQGNHVLLNERADVIDLNIHSDFRLFMCMNPPYSSAGKKQLPQSLRSKISEIYVPELDNESDLWSIIDRYTRQNQHTTLSEEQKRLILMFYVQVKQQVQKQTKRGNIGLRNLCRSLRFMNAAMNLKYPPLKAIYDSLYTCFASHLDPQLQEMVKQQILLLFKIRSLPKLAIAGRQKDERFAYIEDSLVMLGNHKPLNFNPTNFILTKSFRTLVQQLASVISVSDFAVILEGPTSAGKTSCITYLAAVTQNHVIRINNHMHTDVQEYIGSYVPDAESGKLAFQEGILVEAVRKGYWVILDELNLAPSEVLEALNRLLDDNRELHIVETQKVIKAHPSFRIFATQNPTEGYGGRKELSEAFKNRFVMIKVRDVPTDELKQILEEKCHLPSSRASLMVKVMENLQIYRSTGSIFSGKESTITVRDLLKWAGRVNLNSTTNIHMDLYFIALEGFLVLGERSRDAKDKVYIKQTIDKVFGVTINVEEYYEQFFQANLAQVFADIPKELNLPPIVLSRQLKRLATLVYKCLLNKEPVLMVGETGCGKTTLCQVIAHSVTKQQLFAINCHQNTETSDFIGCMRTRKNLSQVQENLSNILDQADLTNEQQEAAKLLSQKNRARYVFGITQNKQIEQLLDDLSCVFEWTDGILVNAMQQGGLLLIDEISLANDSVLERLNSVFEYDRTLVISEKSSAEAVKVVAQEKFNMVATMNPGSDFGKKELSPALRNRMTEIWVESYFQQSELVNLVHNHDDAFIPTSGLLSDIDLHLIIKQLCHLELSPEFSQQVALGIFNLICYVNFKVAAKYFSMQRKSLSIRDIINLVQFIKVNSSQNPLLTQKLDIPVVFKHAVELVIIDGLCLGIDVTNQQEQYNITQNCNSYLAMILEKVFNYTSKQVDECFINTSSHIGVQPFVLERNIANTTSTFAFEAETTKHNLMKLLRAFTLGKPVLIEGPPGVGKTSLVENLAKQTGKKLIRVNLSEQTDMMDLLGSEYPVASVEEDEIKFSWCDGVLLQAIKNGHWFLIDEMNLAQQSILEGLNAILDHRRTVYIPELNQEFTCHPDFFVFACQNPSQSSGQTSGRKTLPKSFLNRFAKIYLDDLTQKDYKVILSHQAKDLFTDEKIDLLLEVTQKINRNQQHRENSAKVNMRDLSRFLTLHRHFMSSQSLNTVHSVAASFQICYKNIDVAIQTGFLDSLVMPKTSLIRVYQNEVTFQDLHKTVIRGTGVSLQFNTRSRSDFSFGDYQELKGEHAQSLHQLCDALHANLPVLLVTNDALKLQKTLAVLSHLHSTQLKRILLNERSDTTQLLGCFEQTSNDIGQIMTSICRKKQENEVSQRIYKLEHDMGWATDDQTKFKLVQDLVEEFPDRFVEERKRLQQFKQMSSRFEWVDSVLVQSVQEGHWAVFENANLCNPSILDRLNGLLEDGAQALTINEQGLIDGQLREVTKHPEFRAMFVVTQSSLEELGKDVSKALRNRCLEIKVRFSQSQTPQFDLLDEKQICAQPLNLIEQLVQTQDQHDQLPNRHLPSEIETIGVTSPGKRQNPEVSMLDVPSLKQQQWKNIDVKVIKPYRHFLCQLKQEQVAAPFMNYMQAEIIEMKQTLQHKLESQVIDRQLQKYLMNLIQTQPLTIAQFHVFLKTIINQKVLRDVVNDAFIVYQANQLPTNVKLQANEDLGFVMEQESIDFQLLKDVQAPDFQLIEHTKLHQTQMPDCDVYVYKMPLSQLMTKNHESRFATIVRQLKFSQANVILIDAEKEIVQDQDKIVKHLEDTCFDMGTVLELPNLVVIPATINDGVVVMSQSFIYESLCFIKDLIKLQKGTVKGHLHMRLSKIPQVVRNTTNEELAIVMRQITMLNLERSYSDKSFQLNLIKAVVNDEQSISLKDLPAAYACTHSLLYKLQELDKHSQSLCEQQQMFDKFVQARMSQRFDHEVWEALHRQWQNCQWKDQPTSEKALAAMKMLARSFSYLSELKTVEIIKAMFVLPLELRKQKSIIELQQQEIDAERFFWEYHYREQVQPELLLQPKLNNLARLEHDVQQLANLAPQQYSNSYENSASDNTQRSLRQTLQFVKILGEEITKIRLGILNNQNFTATEPLQNLVFKQLDTLQFASVSNILCELITGIATLLTTCKQIQCFQANLSPLSETVIGLKSEKNVQVEIFVAMKQQEQQLQESQMKWLLRQGRFTHKNNFKIDSAILEHFVQREVLKRMVLEEKNQELFQLPFKMREQIIPEPLGKAMDEWTEKDKAKMEADAEAQIELNFPSYFDEVQKAYYAGEFKKDGKIITDEVPQEIEVEDILSELLEIPVNTEQVYRQTYLRERIQIVQSVLEKQEGLQNLDFNEWIDDVTCYLSNSLHEQKLKQVMNIRDVRLANSYNFYHSPLPAECKLMYQPLIQLQMRLRDITIRDQYESPLLNESIFLSNYMLTCFNVEITPLMKVLTSIEFLLTKLEEWENTYASKRLNSVETEINTFKLLVIRYRKIQILSWRNLLNWKQEALIREDFSNCIRLAHTITKQVFEGSEEVLKILDLLDLYIRDSTLGIYKPRIKFLQVLKEHFLNKQSNIIRISNTVATRLQYAINCLTFVIAYYSQFKPKLQQTIDRLDIDAREKVKTLIDVSKWTLQKFSIMKNNVDRTHRQLNKACKVEEEVLIQNVQSLVLISSRKKFIGQNDQLLELDSELKHQITFPKLTRDSLRTEQTSIVKQLQYLEVSKVLPMWPSCLTVQSAISGFMERMQDVRALNKKYLQKKAFYDLLKFMKDEGLRPNFQTEFQPLLIQCAEQAPYFVKAYETFILLKSSSQSDENADLKNLDVLRIQGFSQHLMHTTLETTMKVQSLKQELKILDFVPSASANVLPSEVAVPQFGLRKDIKVVSLLTEFKTHLESFISKAAILVQLTHDSIKREELRKCYEQAFTLQQLLPTSVQDVNACSELVGGVAQFLQLVQLKEPHSNRTSRVFKETHIKASQLQQKITDSIIDLEVTIIMSSQQVKQQRALENKVKLFYQDILKQLDLVNSTVIGKNESAENQSTTEGILNQQDQIIENMPDLTMEERLKFLDDIKKVVQTHLPAIARVGKKILFDSAELHTAVTLAPAVILLRKLQSFLTQLCAIENAYLDSIAKFAYLTQRVFLYLIYQGFCGQEESDDPDVEPPSDLEAEGMGMGDGKGGENNVTDQIEHEEQLEGLKNYESDDDQKQEDEKDEKGDDQEEEGGDFEMKEDFDGEMDDEQKSNNSQKQDDEDDELDEVDDMLDNQLWNQNMEDMEEREEKEQKEEKREQDLGQRELQDENMIEQDSQMAEGDHEEREQADPKQEKDQKEDAEMADASEEGERDPDENKDDEQEIGLDNESVPAEPDESFAEESKSASSHENSDQEDSKNIDDESIDSKFQEQMEGQEDLENSGVDEDEQSLDVKNDVNQAVLEDDQIQANEQNKDKNDQANLKKQQENKVESSNNNKQQEKQPDQVDSQQVDPNGNDLLFQFAQKLQQREQNKQQQTKDREQSKQNEEQKPQQVDDPNMLDTDKPVPDQESEQNNVADEYMFDEQAQQTEGKLAADQVQDPNNAHQEEQDDEMKQELDEPLPENIPNEIEMTQQVALNQQQAKNQNQSAQNEKQDDQESMHDEELKVEENQQDLINEYNSYLRNKQTPIDLTQNEQVQQAQPLSRIVQSLEQFDYLKQKEQIRQNFYAWQEDLEAHEVSIDLLAKFKNQTSHVSASLCEQLRIVLEPQLSQNLQGDFKTGKRLNMKKVISFIASNYRNDKIWLRRTLPSKRDYKILIAIDDSLSMKESNLGFFSLEASVALGEALNRLEVGKVAVARIRDRLELVQSFEDQYNSERAAHIISSFDFKHCATTSADTSMSNFVSDANKLLDMQNNSNAVSCPFVIVLSDGRFNKENVKRYMREAKEKRYLYIFVILDQSGTKDQSIMSMRSAIKQQDGGIKLEAYLKDFPFDYYCVVQDISQLPSALGTILVQWFSLVSTSS